MTKSELAKHLDMSERNLADVLANLKLNFPKNSVDEIRTKYIRHLREVAAGRSGEHVIESAMARTRKDTAQATLYEIQIAEKSGQLVPIAKIEPYLTSAIIAARQTFLSLPRKWTQELKALNGFEIEDQYFETDLTDALNQLSEFNVNDVATNDATDNASMGSTSEN